MTQQDYKNMIKLNEIIKWEIGYLKNWHTITELHNHLKEQKSLNKVTEFRGIPIDLAIKFTEPKGVII